MIIGEITNAIIHQVGNKTNGDGVRFSSEESFLGETEADITKMLNKSFSTDSLYQFYFEPTLDLNPIFVFAQNIFNNPSKFIGETQNISRYLYEKCTHPKIKKGEVWMLYIQDCEIDNIITDALCIIKAETKETILQFKQEENRYDIVKQEGFGLNKIDKGCFIYNVEKDNGFVCSIVDSGAKKGDEAKFWIDDFLHVRPIQNSHQKTKAVVDAITSYVANELPKAFEVNKCDQATIINNGLTELKSKKDVSFQDVKEKAFSDTAVLQDFERYLDNYQVDNNIILDGEFEVVKAAVKKTSYSTMTTIKLDKNFDIKVHGGGQYIERGYDDELKMSYYKLYFKKEK